MLTFLMRCPSVWSVLALVLVAGPVANADIRLAQILGPNMVLQREMAVPV